MLFDPAKGATSAAAFAALLAAIVLAILGQIAVATSRARSGRTEYHRYPVSLGLGAILLTLLLSATYMFVLLSGSIPLSTEPNQSRAQLLEVAIQSQRGSAVLFAIAGSMLAVGAPTTLLFLLTVFRESSQADDFAASAIYVSLALGTVVDQMFLVFGYDDIRTAFFGLANSWGWWLSHFVLLVAPTVLVLSKSYYKRRWRPRTEQLAWPKSLTLMPAVLAIIWFVMIPTLAFLLWSNHFFSGAQTLHFHLDMFVLVPLGLWASISFATMLYIADI